MILQQIKDAFGDCKYQETTHCINCDVKSSYINIAEKEFFVYDNDKKEPIKLVPKKDDYQLTVINNTGLAVDVIKTDHCLFTEDTQKCDCLLLNDRQFFLVEIKTSSAGSRSSKRRGAVDQLGATIDALRDNKINLSSHDVKAVICFKSNTEYPTKASANTRRAIFLSDYNIDLVEGNQITFNPLVPVPENGTGNDATVE